MEGADRPYVRTEVRRWFAPFGIPMVPRSALGEYVRCGDCDQTFTDDVLDIVTTDELSRTLEEAAVGLISLVVQRSGGGETVRRAATVELRRFVRGPRSPEIRIVEIARVVDCLVAAAVNMEESGRLQLLAAAVRVAHASGSLTDRNFAALHAAGGGLRVPMKTVRALILSEGVRAD